MRVCNNLPQPNPYILISGGCGRLLHTLTPPRSGFLYLQFLARCHPYILLHFDLFILGFYDIHVNNIHSYRVVCGGLLRQSRARAGIIPSGAASPSHHPYPLSCIYFFGMLANPVLIDFSLFLGKYIPRIYACIFPFSPLLFLCPDHDAMHVCGECLLS